MSTATTTMHDHANPLGRLVTGGAMLWGMAQGLVGAAASLPWPSILGFLGMLLAPVANGLVSAWLADRREGWRARALEAEAEIARRDRIQRSGRG